MLWRSSSPVRHPTGFIAPCLPTNGRAVPMGAMWVYEIKHDGFRFICRRDGECVRVFSRRGIDHSDRAPVIAEALLALNVRSVTIDGEGVVCGPDGVTDCGLQWDARALAKPSSMPSTCWSWTALICAASRGRRAGRH
jgi:ATP-dependent DNA ligase